MNATNGTHDSPTLNTDKTAMIVKVVGMGLMFIIPFLIALSPLKTQNLKNAARFTGIANCFGGGVFFGTCFLHLIPEVKLEMMKYAEVTNNKFMTVVPLAEVLECIGFIVIMFIESIVHDITHGHSHENESNLQNNGTTNDHIPLKVTKDADDNDISKTLNGNHYHKVSENSIHEQKEEKSVAVLIFALAVHSLFEGLAIGVESQSTVFIQLAGAILIHKCVVAFAVGTRLLAAVKTLKEMIICLLIFCISTPLGIGIAMAILDTLQNASTGVLLIVSGSIQGVSTGFFLYITFAEMLFEPMLDKKDLVLKVVAMTVGVLLIGASTIWHNYSELYKTTRAN